MKINCDMGEGLDDVDQQLMPLIDMASIACGGHAGDRESMLRTLDCALEHNTDIGAHPSYPDRDNFGRRSLDIEADTLYASLCQQIDSLKRCADELGANITYIKPHGALYNDALSSAGIQNTLLTTATTFGINLVVQAHPQQKSNASYIFEAFIDRAYDNDGKLLQRQRPGAVFDSVEQAIKQANDLYHKQGVLTSDGHWHSIVADTLCIHSDSPNCVAIAHHVRGLIS